MSQTFVYNSGTYQETNSGTSDLEFGLFFDGTLNNKNNTDLRLKVLNQNDLKIRPTDDVEIILWKEEMIEERRKRFEKDSLDKYSDNKDELDPKDITDYQIADKRSGTDKLGVDNSLMNDYTNVARMWKCCDDNYRIYIEGIGTLDKQKDIDDGFRFGAGETGIRGKVRRGCEELAKKIEPKILKRNDEIIEITLDVFGFSRGAAAARNFLYEVNVSNKREEDTKITKSKKYVGTHLEETSYYTYSTNDIIAEKQFVREYEDILLDKDNVEVDPQYLIDGKMPKYGYLGYYLLEKVKPEVLDRIRLNIRFVGLYDTVSSYEESGNLIKGMRQSAGLTDYFDDDIEQLQLNNLGSFEKAVHFTAMDEHRENFALTHFSEEMLLKPKYNCIEKTFPGVHCDIGGAYETGTEYVDEIENSNYNPELDTLHEDLISKYWYKREQLNLSFFKLSGTRFLRKEYSYIPLHFMQDFFKSLLGNNHQNIITKNVVIDYPISDPQDKILIKVKERLRKYVFRDENKKEEERSEEEKEWRFISDGERKKLLQEEGRKVIDEIKSKRRKEQEKIKKEDQNMVHLEGGTYKKTVTFDSEPKINYAKVLQEVYKRKPIIETQDVLRILRNKYLHWSSNRDWFAMEPTPDRKRKEY